MYLLCVVYDAITYSYRVQENNYIYYVDESEKSASTYITVRHTFQQQMMAVHIN